MKAPLLASLLVSSFCSDQSHAQAPADATAGEARTIPVQRHPRVHLRIRGSRGQRRRDPARQSRLALIGFDHPEAAALTTLMTVRMLSRGFLAGGGFVATLAHEDRHVDSYLGALNEVFAEMAEAIREGDIARRIGGAVKHSGFARLT